jgi:hypothetical protein
LTAWTLIRKSLDPAISPSAAPDRDPGNPAGLAPALAQEGTATLASGDANGKAYLWKITYS